MDTGLTIVLYIIAVLIVTYIILAVYFRRWDVWNKKSIVENMVGDILARAELDMKIQSQKEINKLKEMVDKN
jgi:hypothetical protein